VRLLKLDSGVTSLTWVDMRERLVRLRWLGNKRGDKRWYEVNIPIADRRFAEYLEKTGGGEFL
jgi:hypothetical protein